MPNDTAPTSICILGRQPALGLAELESLYGSGHIVPLCPGIAGLTLAAGDIDFNRLGGSTRLGRVLAVLPSKLWKDVEKQLGKSLLAMAQQLPEGKLQLGISVYGIPVTPAKLTATGLTLKKVVRAKTGRSLRLCPNNSLELGTAQVLHNHLTSAMGVEFLVVAMDNGQTLLAQTVAVQDIESYALRDRGRPKRDARVGMLPPKLAQIIINLATGQLESKGARAKRQELTILDPFCGTGVVLQEALLMGYSPYGTDLEPRMVGYAQENLEWFCSGQTFRGSWRIEQGDATHFTWTPPFDLIASETYLGRAFTQLPDAIVLQKTIRECDLIISKFLRNIASQLAPGTRLCLAIPAWQSTQGNFRYLPLVDHLDDLGYNRISFEHVGNEGLLYYRPAQIVARQLLVLTRK